MRNCLIIANWKLNNNIKMIKTFFQQLEKEHNKINKNIKCHIAIAPSTIYLHLVQKYIINYPYIKLAAQNVDTHLSGAFTGETSAKMLKELGVQYVIIGHSEIRKYHKENDEIIAKKFDIVKQLGMIPILCVGENQIEKNTGQTQSVCKKQLHLIPETLGITAFKNTIIAYEPIWSIGSGTTNTPENIQTVHAFIRKYIANYDTLIANQICIQYGGSVNQTNIQDLLKQPDIDGVLVGSNSLQANNLISMMHTAEKIQYTKIHKTHYNNKTKT